jgi:sulfite reductase (NADPH) flavoprotein alpha-component
MNAINFPGLPAIPENAPFSLEQRAWLNGFLAGLYSAPQSTPLATPLAPPEPEEDFPWHDPALELEERLKLAEDRPLKRRLMAATAQLDCGQCGYLCQTYAEALAEGRETTTTLCVPGAKPTSRIIKQLLAEAPTPTVPAAAKAQEPEGVPVTILSAAPLTTTASAKDVRHVVIDLESSGLTYLPGDSINLTVHNDPGLIEATIAALDAKPGTKVTCPDGQERLLSEAFNILDIARPLDRTLDLLAMAATYPAHAESLRKLVEGDDNAEPDGADLLDLLHAFPSARPPLNDLVRSLPPLRKRLYSIASSPKAHPGQIHLCVSVVKDIRRSRTRLGVGSGFLGFRASTHGPVQASIQTSHFRLPEDPKTPIIMVGPGTGIAPFRSFLADRLASGIKGRAWLFFGDQHEKSDFLYGGTLRAWLKDGTLSRLDTAFSRDQAQKIYVQTRMWEQAADLWRWLQDGAHFYVCGDAMRMARDVDATLRKIAITEGRLTEDQAREWIVALARQGRYLRDIY